MHMIGRILLVALGAFLIVAGLHIKAQTKLWIEQEKKVVTVNGTKTRNAIIGGTVGAATGVGVGAAIGGVGVAACGTGIGIPVGLVCLGLAAIFGGTGAAVGAATGKESEQVTKILEFVKAGPTYSTWIWVTLLSVGAVIIVFAMLPSQPHDKGKEEIS